MKGKLFRNIFLLIAIANSCGLFAQNNLVPNPSFENYFRCPQWEYGGSNNTDGKGLAFFIYNWSLDYSGYIPNQTYSNEYNNSCSKPDDCCSVPKNFWGNMPAATGNAYARYTVIVDPFRFKTYYRPFWGSYLTKPMKIGTKYKVSFKIAPTDSNYFAINKFGINFYKGRNVIRGYSDIFGPHYQDLSNKAHVYTDTIIKEKKWYNITSIFKADHDYDYLQFGNYFEDSLLQKFTPNLPNQYKPQFLNFFIDDIDVIELQKKIWADKTNICLNDSIQLIALNLDTIHWWSSDRNGNNSFSKEDTLFIKPKSNQTIYLFEESFGLIDSLEIKVFDTNLKILRTDTSFCYENHIDISPNIDALRYLWSTNETTKSISVFRGGNYKINAYLNNCMISDSIQVKICDSRLFVPNAFTPNGDEINGVFLPKGVQIYNYNLTIYNKWGQQVFQSNDLRQGWDGGDYASDVYFYIINYSDIDNIKTYKLSGNVSLLR